MFSFAPFPSKIWGATPESTLDSSAISRYSDGTATLNPPSSLFTMDIDEKALWFQPRDNVPCLPQKPAQDGDPVEELYMYKPKEKRHGSGMEIKTRECAYCKGIGKPSAGHGRKSCPVLFSMKPCSLCGADGYDNHTRSHCPSQQKVTLELKEEHLYGMEMRKAKRCSLAMNFETVSPEGWWLSWLSEAI